MSVLKVTNVNFSFGNRTILEDASFVMQKGEHIGLVGMNGEGKSTFIKMITGTITPDSGKIEWNKRVKVGYLDQYSTLKKGFTIRDTLKEAFDYMYQLEKNIYQMYDEMANLSNDKINELLEEIGDIQSTLEHNGFYNLDAKIEEVANGLGLGEIGLERMVDELSGGQRSKVLLTKLLLSKPEILILDEPTNFLDEDQINWLASYLENYENAFLLVSHDIGFLNRVINVIYHIEDGILTRYTGNYDKFMEMYELKKKHQNIAYEKQQKEITKLETFIAKNKARVATTNLAKSRQRILDKMEIIDKAKEGVKPNFIFKKANASGKFPIVCENLVIGYDEALSRPINFVVERGKKLAIKGVNGIGKSTLLKTLVGRLKPISGSVKLDYNLEYAYFAQEENFPSKMALDYAWDFYPAYTNAEIRGMLAAVGLNKDKIETMMMVLSGGEQAKVRLAILGNTESNMLILDEPTNHLDVLAKESLKEALKDYKGTILLVCHESDFYDGLVDEVVNAEEWTLKLI